MNTHPNNSAVVLASTEEVLRTKLSIWESRAKYLTGAKKKDAQNAVADLKAKLAAL